MVQVTTSLVKYTLTLDERRQTAGQGVGYHRRAVAESQYHNMHNAFIWDNASGLRRGAHKGMSRYSSVLEGCPNCRLTEPDASTPSTHEEG